MKKECKMFVSFGALSKLPSVIRAIKAHRCVIITDSTVKKMFAKKTLDILHKAGITADLIFFPAGERSKNIKTFIKLADSMLKKKCGRDTLILALGGGVVGDMAGFLAAVYMRGIPYIQIPTTLLAMVDSAIGGKTAIDAVQGKNLLGAFYRSSAIIADLDFIKNLPASQLLNGKMEMVKIALTSDRRLFSEILKKEQIPSKKIIIKAANLKMKIVGKDEREANERMILNFGHTIGHAMECVSDFRLQHGVGVGLGILVESKISNLLGILSGRNFTIIREALKQLGINESMIRNFNAGKIIKQTLVDKKTNKGEARYVLLEKIGKVKMINGKFGHVVPSKTVKTALNFFKH